MSATTVEAIRDRVCSLLVTTPFAYVEAVTPFSFDLQPEGVIDQALRIETEFGDVIGGMGYAETRVDLLRLWVARLHADDPRAVYRTLLTDATSIAAAVVLDGATGGGDYHVPDEGRGWQIQQQPGQAFAVLRLTLPVDYEAQL